MAVKISAIVSAYYAEKYIERRIANLQEQTLLPEIVVICQDGSFEQKIAADAGAVVISTPGIPSLPIAWNMGIKKAHGKYITTANSDDQFYKTGLEQLVQVAEQNDAAVCFSDVDLQQGDKLPQVWKRILEQKGIIQDAYKKFSKRCIVGSMPIWKRSLHKTYGYFDESLSIVCDWDFWLRLSKAGETFYYHSQPTGIYLMRSDSLERKDRDATQAEKKIVRERYG